ncbi:hypothetical protein NT6N_36070 [Oceaniferula spumae]|uniref:Uncharacterized protein n=1 Tax=Oceaniferula spumae TaxID=2979115 RepID=A0AAT9FRQ0_9BACT
MVEVTISCKYDSLLEKMLMQKGEEAEIAARLF